ncbi:putative metalloprotease CJM1_0395 family protein [Roseibium sp.]|uniref:putative metalloprotease CJM1_0395 family protein n=1 Tax=Roseibium sp. TaxID=1936156 RepID=UPI003D0EC595
MIGALLTNTPANLLRSSGAAAPEPDGGENPQSRDQDLARESQAGSRAAASRISVSPPLTAEAVLVLQEDSGAEASTRRFRQDASSARETAGVAGAEETSSSASQGQSVSAVEDEAGTSQPAQEADGGKAGSEGLSEAEEKQVDKLEQRDREVKAHEHAHARAGGAYAGAPSYTFQQGPDGKSYAVGGEVQIDTAKERTPEATVRKMQVVIRAATAPAEPSSQDLKVAQQARAQLAEAQAELRQQKSENTGTGGDGPQTVTATESGKDAAQDAGSPASDARPEDGESGSASSSSRYGQAVAAYQAAVDLAGEASSRLFGLIA